MKLVVAGSRHLNLPWTYIEDVCILKGLYSKEIVCGGARGVDYTGWLFAKNNKLSCTQFQPQWKLYGKSAGPKRNRLMAEYGDALLLIWDGKSKGSKNMKEEMEKLKKPIYEVIYREEN